MFKEVEIFLPVKGKIIPLTEVEDYLFSRKVLGEGIAIEPEDNYVYSPVDGTVELVYEKKHVILISTKEGLKILIHLGLDSNSFAGKGIACYINPGDTVKKGDKILWFDKEYLTSKISLTTPVLIVNTELIKTLDINYNASNLQDTIMKAVVY
ncbi:PTS sugar transporter subunit IIA [Haloimpatiens lingqiaonensis]|uniref:PTS sugar transporter subunit IIA n=1 Tax=Haloimpatiens lingqiaonensis TaxID=1380675 RepID=UPI0010FE3E97|nr:PTS glucose transporter subunit IIA [Haloimpatiens lingqiaonensis]